MRRTVFTSASPAFLWLDVVEPTLADLEQVARDYGLPPTAVKDCLDPEHLPKFERFERASFAILRAYDEQAPADADTIQGLTRKVALFYGPGFLVTIHRKDQPYLDALMHRWQAALPATVEGADLGARLLADLALGVVLGYDAPLADAEGRLDAFEATVLHQRPVTPLLRELYLVKRRITLAKRLLWHTMSVVHRLPLDGGRHASLFQDLEEEAESMHFYADELLEDANNLLHMQLSLAAHRTNEVMKVLTVFSAFFLPLTFIVGVYGMNFTHMPELAQPWGYPAVLALMAGVSVAIWTWFRRRGWL